MTTRRARVTRIIASSLVLGSVVAGFGLATRSADAAGFKYAWDAKTQQFAHASGFLVATPQGVISRYFFGIEYAPRDLKFALIESSAGRVGNVIDQVLLYCYHYDPQTGSYSFVAMKAVQLGGAFTLLALVGFVVVALRREQRAGH